MSRALLCFVVAGALLGAPGCVVGYSPEDPGTGTTNPGADAGRGGPTDTGGTTPGEDAWVDPGGEDAWVMPMDPDAYVCPTWSDVAPILQAHCGDCHGTQRPAFVGNRTTASTNMTAIISAGTSPGSMAFRDPMGGFSTAEDDLMRAWKACGSPP